MYDLLVVMEIPLSDDARQNRFSNGSLPYRFAVGIVVAVMSVVQYQVMINGRWLIFFPVSEENKAIDFNNYPLLVE